MRKLDKYVELLKKKLKEKYPNKETNFLIISGGKELPDFVDETFDIYDITKEYTFTETQLKELAVNLKERSKVNDEIFPNEIVDLIVSKTRLWNQSSIRTTPTSMILACSLSLAESIKLAEESKEKITISKKTAEKWSLLGTSPWYQKYNELHDVHAEFLVFNGKKYVDVDRHYQHPLP